MEPHQPQWPGPGQPGYGQPGPPGYPPQQPYPGPPGYAPAPLSYPVELKSVAIFQIVAGAVAILIGLPVSFFVVVLGSMGFGLILTPLWVYGLAVAILEIINGIKTLQGSPFKSKFWWTALPIMAICSLLVSDWLSMAAGIWVLTLTSKPHIRAWMQSP